MKIRPDIVKLLRSGCSDTEVSTRLGVARSVVSHHRTTLGLPRAKPGPKPKSPQESFRRNTKAVGDHLEWAGPRMAGGTPLIHWYGRRVTAARLAFVLAHNRVPVGNVTAGCGHPGCVAPAHMEDRPMRDQLKAQMDGIFGGAA